MKTVASLTEIADAGGCGGGVPETSSRMMSESPVLRPGALEMTADGMAVTQALIKSGAVGAEMRGGLRRGRSSGPARRRRATATHGHSRGGPVDVVGPAARSSPGAMSERPSTAGVYGSASQQSARSAARRSTPLAADSGPGPHTHLWRGVGEVLFDAPSPRW